jgi:N-acetylglucosamine kinase-like BadF-type ATPase
MKYFVGFDVGASKTDALIVDATGQCVGFGKAGGGNYQAVGWEGLRTALRESLAAALAVAGLDKAQIAGAGFGIAGYDFPSDREPHLEAIASLGLSCPVEVVNDGVNGLLAGATRGVGVNVTAGSSNNCRGRNRTGKEGRIVGNSSEFGEHGGAIEIVQRGLHMVNYAWIQRRPPTALTAIYLEAFGAKDVLALMEGLSNKQYELFPDLATRVIDAARDGDATAQEVIHWAGEELGWLAVAVARQIGMEDEEVEIILSGSLFGAGTAITEPMERIVLQYCPRARLIRLDGPPVVGAVMVGMERANFDGYAVRDVMVRTAKGVAA